MIDRKIKWLHSVRDYELHFILDRLPKNNHLRILELGSGTGYQLSKIKEKYPRAVGVEIESSAYDTHYEGVYLYNGLKLPFPNCSFDVVISSHVLEHVPSLQSFHSEVKRVLDENGSSIHIMPSHVWRLWTSILHYFNAILFVIRYVFRKVFSRNEVVIASESMSRSKIIKNLLFSETHGVKGNPITELYYFHPNHWEKNFKAAGYLIKEIKPIGLFYWGRDQIMDLLPINQRVVLARLLGSSSYLYVVKSKQNANSS